MKRLFVALKITPEEELQDAFAFLKERLHNEAIKWVDSNSLHLTLKFIGEVDDKELPFIDAQLKKFHGIPSFSFFLEGVGVFRNLNDPRVFYVNVRDKGETAQLSTLVNSTLREIGLEPEKKDFTPHLTLGRIKFLKNKPLLEEVLFDFRNHYFQSVLCSEFVLYESLLSPKGPTYKALAHYALE